MPCNHKFIDNLSISYADWEVRTLFIGTFNPCWLAANNDANWFYGRTARNEFWCILPKIHENISLINDNKDIWVNFCRKNHLAITDILESLDNADEQNEFHRQAILGFRDNELQYFDSTKTDIIDILETHPTIKQICITRQDPLPIFWLNCFQSTFDWINHHPERNISIKYLRSPSRGARRGVMGNFCDFVANRWIEQGYEIL